MAWRIQKDDISSLQFDLLDTNINSYSSDSFFLGWVGHPSMLKRLFACIFWFFFILVYLLLAEDFSLFEENSDEGGLSGVYMSNNDDVDGVGRTDVLCDSETGIVYVVVLGADFFDYIWVFADVEDLFLRWLPEGVLLLHSLFA